MQTSSSYREFSELSLAETEKDRKKTLVMVEETNHSSEEQEEEVEGVVEEVEEEEDTEEPQDENPQPEQDPEQDKIKPVIYIGLLLTSLFALGKIWLIESESDHRPFHY